MPEKEVNLDLHGDLAHAGVDSGSAADLEWFRFAKF